MPVTAFLLLAWAAPHASPGIVIDAASLPGAGAPSAEALTGSPSSPLTGFSSGFQDRPGAGMPLPPPRPRQRFTVKGGYFDASEDELDDGGSVIVSWTRPMSKTLSSEVEIGYLDVSGSDNGVDRDVWSISFMANGRATVPVGERIELYGGLGLGTFYYDAEATLGPVTASGDGFLFGGAGYFGGSIRVGESLSIGLEGKYYVTDETSELDGGLEGFLALLTVGFGV